MVFGIETTHMSVAHCIAQLCPGVDPGNHRRVGGGEFNFGYFGVLTAPVSGQRPFQASGQGDGQELGGEISTWAGVQFAFFGAT